MTTPRQPRPPIRPRHPRATRRLPGRVPALPPSEIDRVFAAWAARAPWWDRRLARRMHQAVNDQIERRRRRDGDPYMYSDASPGAVDTGDRTRYDGTRGDGPG
jgi:hypothetical protein